MKKLEEIIPADYGMDVETTIAASALLGYLALSPKEHARETIAALVGQEENMSREQMQVDIERLASVIDISTDFIKEIIERRTEEAPGTTADVEHQTQVMLDGLEHFDSERIAKNIQGSFLNFLYDCYQAVMD